MAHTPATSAAFKPLIESDRVEGTAVFGSDGGHVGTVKRLMIEKVTGQVAYAIISFSGVPETGRDLHTIPWGKLNYDKELGGYRTDITKSQLVEAPGVHAEELHDPGTRDREKQLHDYYDIPPYWRAL
jgi:hypothetical protein